MRAAHVSVKYAYKTLRNRVNRYHAPMTRRITVAAKIEDARAANYLRILKNLFPKAKLTDVAVAQSYTIDAKLSANDLKQVAGLLANPVIEVYSTTKVLAPKKYAWAIEIGFLPGVTDNVAKTVRQII